MFFFFGNGVVIEYHCVRVPPCNVVPTDSSVGKMKNIKEWRISQSPFADVCHLRKGHVLKQDWECH